MRGSKNARDLPLAALLISAAGLYAWNAFSVTALTGYDAPGHAAYILTILRDNRLPAPLEGWSTFHPPLYYLLGAAVWSVLEPFGARVIIAGLRGLSALSLLAVGAVTYSLALRLGAEKWTARLAAALVLFVPVAQLSATMVGNEALAAGLAALALPWILVLQEKPWKLGAAAMAGLFCGLALATKFTGLFVAAACVTPFLRRDLDGRMARALALLVVIVGIIAAPVYLRNLARTGTPFPMTRDIEPMKSMEAAFERPSRRIVDYLWIPPGCLLRPSVFHVPKGPDSTPQLNERMFFVWGLVYASIWYDSFAVRVPLRFHRDGVPWGPLLAFLGLIPTVIMLFGFGAEVRECARGPTRSPLTPLVAMCLAALAIFLIFTWRAPSLVASKGSYLLPLIAAGGIFFARGVGRLSRRLRTLSLGACAVAVLASALVFTSGLAFPPEDPRWVAHRVKVLGKIYPPSRFEEVVDLLILPPPPLAPR